MIDHEPRIVLRTGSSAPAFEYCLPAVDGLLLKVPFSCPSASHVMQTVVGSARQVPRACCGLFYGEGLFGAIFNIGGAAKNS